MKIALKLSPLKCIGVGRFRILGGGGGGGGGQGLEYCVVGGGGEGGGKGRPNSQQAHDVVMSHDA